MSCYRFRYYNYNLSYLFEVKLLRAFRVKEKELSY